MERAEILGVNVIRVFAFTYPSNQNVELLHYPRIYELMKEALRRAKRRNMRLALENVGGSYISTAAELFQICLAIRDETLGLVWDPNNSAASGGRPFPEGYGALDPARILHVHLRDYRRKPDGTYEWCGVGQGEFDHLGQLRALLADGYQGTYSLETHFKIEGSKAKASEASLQGLLKVIQQV
jgi:sugar phosphate isomerase/epimerase